MTDVVTGHFDPNWSLEQLRAHGVRAALASVRSQWLEWCVNVTAAGTTFAPPMWAGWMAGGEGDWTDNQAQDTWDLDLERFLAYAREHPALFPPVSQGDTMTDTATPVRITADMLRTLTNDDISHEVLNFLESAYLAWQRTTASDGPSNLAAVREHPQRHPGRYYDTHFISFISWLRQHPDALPTPAPEPEPINTVPIGPDHPGWQAWWDRLWETSQGEYEREYNALAEALGGPERVEEERDYVVEVRIEAFTVIVRRSARPSDVENDADDAFDISQSDIDEAVREYTHSEDVNYSIEDWSED